MMLNAQSEFLVLVICHAHTQDINKSCGSVDMAIANIIMKSKLL